MEIMDDLSYSRIVIAGRTQTGKTSFVRCALLPWLGSFICYDPDLQFTGYGKIVETIPELRKAIVKDGHRRIIFQPRDLLMGMAEERVEEFELICRTIDKLQNVTFIIDEISHITRPEFRRSAFIPPVFAMIIKRREKLPHRIGVICTTQRLADSDINLLSQSRYSYSFQLNAHDAEYVSKKWGMGKDMQRQLEALPLYKYIKYNHETGALSTGTFEYVPYPGEQT